MLYTRTLILSLLQWLQEEAVHLFGPANGLHQPQAERLQTKRGALPPTEKRPSPTDHGEIRDQHQSAGERSVTLCVASGFYSELNQWIWLVVFKTDLLQFHVFLLKHACYLKCCMHYSSWWPWWSDSRPKNIGKVLRLFFICVIILINLWTN